jgi:hypothetical protein
MMNHEDEFKDIREEIENKQKAILWEDARKGGRGVDAFLWKGDPYAKPVQRIGLIVFGAQFLFLAVFMSSIPFQKHFDDGWPVEFLMATGSFLISLRLFRNAFLRPRTPK